jgi:hypothetical protein
MRHVCTLLLLAACSGGSDSQLTNPDAATDAFAQTFTCGTGTVENSGVCIPTAARYAVRISEPVVGANGRTKRKVVVFGTKADGTAALDRVVLTASRATAGTLRESALNLTTLGAYTYFTPCNSASPDCLGPVTFSVALASAPSTVVAQTDVMIVAPSNVSTIAPCLEDDKVFWVDGAGGILTTQWTVFDGDWWSSTFANSIQVSVDAADDNLSKWHIEAHSMFVGGPLTPGMIFENAQKASSQIDGYPGLGVSGNSYACNTVDGRFQIHKYTQTPLDILVSFEQKCDGSSIVLEGCVRYKP